MRGSGPRCPRTKGVRGDQKETFVTAVDATTMTDEDLLAQVRSESARWEARDESQRGFAQLRSVRDEALSRGLPLPMACPVDPLPGAEDQADPLAEETR